MTAEPEVIVEREGRAGIIRLNRPKALNALNVEMVRIIQEALTAFASDDAVALVLIEGAGDRALCAGGDIVGLYNSAKAGGKLGHVFFREEYILNARIARYAKPYVALMDGIVMGGGVGLSAHGAHRIVTDRTRIAMPEVGIGFFPDVGGTYLLSRAPGQLGVFFALTGDTMTGADAIDAGLADTFVPRDRWPDLRAALTEAPSLASAIEVDQIIGRFVSTPEPGVAQRQRDAIDRLFGFDSVEKIVAALERDGSDFAVKTLETMRTKSPTSMKVTLRLLRQARQTASLEECLINEYRASLTVFESAEFAEGVRAAVIDKDRKPKWNPARIDDVTDGIVDRYFAPRGADEMTLADFQGNAG